MNTTVEGLILVDRSGVQHDLGASLAAGKKVALIFWQTWCGSCLEEAPQLAKDAKQWGQDILFLGVIPGPKGSVDEAAVDQVVAKFGLPYAQVRDTELALTKRFEVQGTPTIIVLGVDGRILFRGHQAPANWGDYVN